jgi:hypothetical protein
VTTRRSEDLDVPASCEKDVALSERKAVPVHHPAGRKRSGAPVTAEGGEAQETARRVVNDALESARVAYERAGRGCMVSLRSEEPRYATVAEMAGRLGPHPEIPMLMHRSQISTAPTAIAAWPIGFGQGSVPFIALSIETRKSTNAISGNMKR